MGGTRYITNSPPPNYDGEMIRFELPKPRGVVLRHLQSVAKLIRRVSPSKFEAFNIAPSIVEIEAWCGNRDLALRSPEWVIQNMLVNRDPALPLSSIVEGAFNVLNGLMTEFSSLRVPGIVSQKAAATLAFFSFHPFPDDLNRVVDEVTFGLRNTLGALDVTTVIVPPMTLGLYLSHPSLAGVPSFFSARGAARFRSKQGRAKCLTALSARTIGDYHSELYAALFLYRGALEIYSELKFIAQHVPTIW